MKQTMRRKIALKRETVRRLSEASLAGAVGGLVWESRADYARRGTGPVDSCEDCTGGAPGA
jgi:hypothetical protein